MSKRKTEIVMSRLKKYMSFQYPRGCTLRMLVVFLSDVYHNFRKSKLCLFINV